LTSLRENISIAVARVRVTGKVHIGLIPTGSCDKSNAVQVKYD